MTQRALVVVLGQLRAHELTWAPFKKHVIEQLNADLAVCVPDDTFFDFTNPYYLNARYRWVVPDPPDAADTFDRIQRLLGSSEDWRVLCDVRGAWLGRVRQANQPGSTALLFILRWFMLNNIEAAKLGEVYDRFIITRSDYFYLAPHPPVELLDPDSIWIPDGEDYGGICDRHLVVSPSDLVSSCNLLDEILCRPQQLREAMVARLDWDWTTERSLALHFSRNGLAAKIRRFPFVMFLVRGPSDPTTWSPGEYADEVDMLIKYRSEFNEARRNERHLRSDKDWRRFFAACQFEHLFPARVYTNHGTVVYVAGDGELRHGPLEESPANLWFVRCGSDGVLVHRTEDRLLCAVRVSDQGQIFFDLDDAQTPSPILFERVLVTGTNFVGLRSGGIYLRADPGRQVLLNQTYCRGCEHFRLIPDLHEADSRAFMTGFAGLITNSAFGTWARRQEIPPASTGELDISELRRLLATERPVILDIGANDGVKTMALLRVFPEAEIYAFEPDPRAAERFKNRADDPRVRFCEAAIGAGNGTAEFYASDGTPPWAPDLFRSGWDRSGSVRRPKNHHRFWPWVRFDRTITVELRQLDAWAASNGVDMIDFLRADVRGAEEDLIAGGRTTLAATRYFYTDYSDYEIYEGQPGLAQLIDTLPEFELVHRFEFSALFRNRRL